MDECQNCEKLDRRLIQRDRLHGHSMGYWVEAAEAALALLPEASNSTHPAHRLWLRVQCAKAPVMDVVLSEAI